MRRFFILGLAILHSAAAAETWQLNTPDTAFDYTGSYSEIEYQPIEKASENWSICVSYPHLKDAYWLSVNYGMVEEARRLGVSFQLVEAGGYPNLERQIQQIETCVNDRADALILGTVSFDGLTETVERIARNVPVIAAVNDIADAGITAKVGVSWTEMGAEAGRVIARAHPKGSAPVKVAWFPGPEQAGWVTFVQAGFRAAIQDSAAEIAVTKFGDTGREIQVLLIEEALDEVPDLDYIVGSAPAAEAAVSVLRARGLEDQIQIVSDYFTHAVHRGIRRDRIIAAPTDMPVLQGRLSIEMAVRAIQGQLLTRHAGPAIQVISGADADVALIRHSLAPATFVPVFELEAKEEPDQ